MAKWTRGLTNIKYMMTKCNIFEQSLKKCFMSYLKWNQKSEFIIKIWDLRFKMRFEFNPRNKDEKTLITYLIQYFLYLIFTVLIYIKNKFYLKKKY